MLINKLQHAQLREGVAAQNKLLRTYLTAPPLERANHFPNPLAFLAIAPSEQLLPHCNPSILVLPLYPSLSLNPLFQRTRSSGMPGQLKSFIGSIRRKPTKAADGRPEAANGAANGGPKTSIGYDLLHLGAKNAGTMATALTTLASGEPLDDKDLLLENGVSMLQGLPLNSGLSEKVSDGFISMLWHDLPHPPPAMAGPTARYRRHDGGNNNPWAPEMGKAGSPYSRSVPPIKPKGPNLPNVEDVFEALLKRDGPFKTHPSGLNRLFFSFATVVIHECFQTSRKDPWINETSSYVDLSTLYGNTEKEQKRVRTYEDGTIFPDSIASERIMMMPPGVVAVMILFSRNHNYIAESLLSVNEDGKYKPWDALDDAGKKW